MKYFCIVDSSLQYDTSTHKDLWLQLPIITSFSLWKRTVNLFVEDEDEFRAKKYGEFFPGVCFILGVNEFAFHYRIIVITRRGKWC